MKELKYRAWDKHCKYFIYFGEKYWFNDDENTITFQCDRVMGDHDDGKRFIFLRYTGLKDVKDRDIYEGDITNYGEVVWVSLSASFRINPSRKNKDISFMESFMNYDDVEIIGNIQENPELLNESQSKKDTG